MFARKYRISINVVIQPAFHKLNPGEMTHAFVDRGTLDNSGEFNGMDNIDAIDEITKYLEKKGIGRATVSYKLRDWLISRQRYWGTPIPMVYCKKCGIVPVPEKDLPVILPTDVKFTGEGNPLLKSENFVNTRCPKCRSEARRETDTMDTFVDSSWYFLRYCSPKENAFAFDKKAVKYWLPVDEYIGGVEHAVMHLMYARFFTMVLHDIGLLDFEEPFQMLFNQGIVYKDGHKMSKSFGNVVTQEEMSEKYGIDTARLFLMFVASPESQLEWSDRGVQGAYRFLGKIYRLVNDNADKASFGIPKSDSFTDRILEARLAQTISQVSGQIEGFQFNLALSSIMELVNYLSEYVNSGSVNKNLLGDSFKVLVQMISPFAPHMAEELWEKMGLGGFVSASRWPEKRKVDGKALAMEKMTLQLGQDIEQVLKLANIKPKKILLVVAPAWKYELFTILKREAEKTRDAGKIIKVLMEQKGLRQHGNDIAKLVPVLVKSPEKIPELILSPGEEAGLLKELCPEIGVKFGCSIIVESAEKSSSKKAFQAMPGKPGIEVF